MNRPAEEWPDLSPIALSLVDSASRAMLSDSERYIIEAMGIDRSEAIKRAMQGRIVREIKTDGSEIYLLDGVPFLRMGPISTVQKPAEYPNHVAFAITRTVERIARPSPTP